MDNAGLIGKFKVNRPLTKLEKQYHLKQKQRLKLEPHYQMSVIKLNSTYLESVDKWYGDKGTITLIGLAGIIMLSIFGISTIGLLLLRGFGIDPSFPAGDNNLLDAFILILILAPAIWGLIWFLKKESFSFTHYPIRFNRKSGQVYVFDTDGNVFFAPWNDLYFTLAQVDTVYKFWNVFGHILSADGSTVLKSFTLSVSKTGDTEGLSLLRSHWEFIRRYMEDGPEITNQQVQFCLPISERRESFMFGVHRLLANNSGVSRVLLPFILISMVFDLITMAFRYFAIRTSKIPSGPALTEEDCRVDENDPYAIVGMPDGERKAVYPKAAALAGVDFIAKK